MPRLISAAFSAPNHMRMLVTVRLSLLKRNTVIPMRFCAFIESFDEAARLVINFVLDVGKFDPAVSFPDASEATWNLAFWHANTPDEARQFLKRIKIVFYDEVLSHGAHQNPLLNEKL